MQNSETGTLKNCDAKCDASILESLYINKKRTNKKTKTLATIGTGNINITNTPKVESPLLKRWQSNTFKIEENFLVEFKKYTKANLCQQD